MAHAVVLLFLPANVAICQLSSLQKMSNIPVQRQRRRSIHFRDTTLVDDMAFGYELAVLNGIEKEIVGKLQLKKSWASGENTDSR